MVYIFTFAICFCLGAVSTAQPLITTAESTSVFAPDTTTLQFLSSTAFPAITSVSVALTSSQPLSTTDFLENTSIASTVQPLSTMGITEITLEAEAPTTSQTLTTTVNVEQTPTSETLTQTLASTVTFESTYDPPTATQRSTQSPHTTGILLFLMTILFCHVISNLLFHNIFCFFCLLSSKQV